MNEKKHAEFDEDNEKFIRFIEAMFHLTMLSIPIAGLVIAVFSDRYDKATFYLVTIVSYTFGVVKLKERNKSHLK